MSAPLRILFLASDLPHPRAVSGHTVVFNRIKGLAGRGHRLGLAAFCQPSSMAHADAVRPFLHEFEVLPRPRRPTLARRLLQYWIGSVPRPFAYVTSNAMRRLVGDMIHRSHYDVAVAEFSPMGQYFFRNPYLPAVRRVISCHTCYTTMLRGALRVRDWRWAALRILLDLRAVRRYEFEMYRCADHVLTLTSDVKMELLNSARDLPVSVVPFGVDTGHFSPGDPGRIEDIVLLTGYFSHEANRDAVLWFVRTVWPHLRARHSGLRFFVVGRDPRHEMRDLARRDPRIVVTGEVEDMAPYLRRARVFVCPVRMGRGLRVKVLEAMACGTPVVTTTLGAEGIPAQSGENMMLADGEHTMVESIELLLTDPSLCDSIARNARRLAVSQYSLNRCIGIMEDVLQQIARQGPTRSRPPPAAISDRPPESAPRSPASG